MNVKSRAYLFSIVILLSLITISCKTQRSESIDTLEGLILGKYQVEQILGETKSIGNLILYEDGDYSFTLADENISRGILDFPFANHTAGKYKITFKDNLSLQSPIEQIPIIRSTDTPNSLSHSSIGTLEFFSEKGELIGTYAMPNFWISINWDHSFVELYPNIRISYFYVFQIQKDISAWALPINQLPEF